MPNYDYLCKNCGRKFVVYLTYQEYGQKEVRCTHCQSDQVSRKIGRIRLAKSDEAHLENMADPDNLAALDNDPQALGRMMRQMSSQMGEEMGPEFNEVVDRLEKGQSPEEIDTEIPGLGEAGE